VLQPTAAVVMNVLMHMHAISDADVPAAAVVAMYVWQCVAVCCRCVGVAAAATVMDALMHMLAQANADRVAAVVELMRVLQCCAGVCSVLQQQLWR